MKTFQIWFYKNAIIIKTILTIVNFDTIIPKNPVN